MWAVRYVGLPYDEVDCVQLVQRVLREERGVELPVPSERDAEFNPFSVSRLIAENRVRFAPVATNHPQDFDLVMMLAVAGRVNHIGVYVSPRRVLHAVKSAGQVCLHRLAALPTGMRVQGIYRWSP